MNSISVVIPTFNRPNKIRDAILSISRQTQLPDELVVVDDGSDISLDESIFEGLKRKVVCKLLHNKKSMGANYSRNKGVLNSESEWIAFLDDDDEFEPQKIDEIKKVISENKSVDFIYHSATIFMVNEGVYYRSGSSCPVSDNVFQDLLVKNIVGGTSVATIRKSALEEVDGFDEKLPALQDYDLWLRLAKAKKKFHFIDKPLLKYHHETKTKSISKSLSKNKIAIETIEGKNKEDFESLSKQQFKEHEMWKQKMRVHKSLMNMQYKEAIREQMTYFHRFPSIKSFIELLVVFAGPKVAFKVKSVIN